MHFRKLLTQQRNLALHCKNAPRAVLCSAPLILKHLGNLNVGNLELIFEVNAVCSNGLAARLRLAQFSLQCLDLVRLLLDRGVVALKQRYGDIWVEHPVPKLGQIVVGHAGNLLKLSVESRCNIFGVAKPLNNARIDIPAA